MASKSYVEERDRAFESDDLEWARRRMPNASPRAAEAAFHKARLEVISISEAKRQASLDWLRDNGFRRYGRGPLPKDLASMDADVAARREGH